MGFSKALKIGVTFAFATLMLPDTAAAQSTQNPIPERRIELSENTDFYGSDLRNVFDVAFEDCVAVCLADAAGGVRNSVSFL